MTGVPVILGSHFACVPTAGQCLEDFIFETVSAALKAWNIEMRDVDSVVTASSDGLDGRAISLMVTGASAGAYRKDVINLSSASEHALFYQAARVRAGRTRLGLVVAWGKPSETTLHEIDRITDDPFFVRVVPHDRNAYMDMQERAFLSRLGLGANDFTPIGTFYPTALVLADCCAVLLVAPTNVRHHAAFPVRISGMGLAIGSYWQGRCSMTEWPALKQAAGDAAAQAGIVSPVDEIDAFELGSLSAVQEVIAAIALGLTRADDIASYIANRASGFLVINPSGGLRGAFPEFGSGLLTVARACVALSHVPPNGKRPRRALAHGMSGDPAQAHSVFILEEMHA